MAKHVIALGPIDLQTLIANTYSAIHDTGQSFNRILLEFETDKDCTIIAGPGKLSYYPVDEKYKKITSSRGPAAGDLTGVACPYPPKCTNIKFADDFTEEKFEDCVKLITDASNKLAMK